MVSCRTCQLASQELGKARVKGQLAALLSVTLCRVPQSQGDSPALTAAECAVHATPRSRATASQACSSHGSGLTKPAASTFVWPGAAALSAWCFCRAAARLSSMCSRSAAAAVCMRQQTEQTSKPRQALGCAKRRQRWCSSGWDKT